MTKYFIKTLLIGLFLSTILLAKIEIVDNKDNTITITQITPNGPNSSRNITIGQNKKNNNSQLNYQVVNNQLIITDTINPNPYNQGDITALNTDTINNDLFKFLFLQGAPSQNLTINLSNEDRAYMTEQKQGQSPKEIDDLYALNNYVSINDNSINSVKIQNGSIQNEDIQDNSITSEKIKNGSIQNEDIKDGTISLEKLAPSVQNKFIDLKKGMAMQAAMTMSTLALENKKLTLNLGYGSYSGYSAIASGLNYKVKDNLAIKASVSSDLDKQLSGAAGISFGIDL
eukprot:COSAG01_NODE_2372_length_7810_cov_5.360135_2_plen_286_part_00